MKAIDAVRDFIVENFLYGEDGRITGDTSFLRSSIIDASGVFELAAFLEEAFGIRVEDDELLPENLDSLNSIERFLARKLEGREPRQVR